MLNDHATSAPPKRASFTDAVRSLSRAQKPNYGAPAYSRWVNRPLGRLLAAGAYRIGMTPNQVTAASAACTYAAIGVVAFTSPSGALSFLIAALLLLGYALDSADGQLARLTGTGRPSGEWLDHVVDMGKICLLNGAVALSWYRWGSGGFPAGPWEIAIPVLMLTVGVVSFFGWLLSDLLMRVARARIGAAPDTKGRASAPVLRSLLRLPSDYGLLALSFLWYSTWAFSVTYTFLLVANAVILVAALPTWFGQVRASEEMT